MMDMPPEVEQLLDASPKCSFAFFLSFDRSAAPNLFVSLSYGPGWWRPLM